MIQGYLKKDFVQFMPEGVGTGLIDSWENRIVFPPFKFAICFLNFDFFFEKDKIT